MEAQEKTALPLSRLRERAGVRAIWVHASTWIMKPPLRLPPPALAGGLSRAAGEAKSQDIPRQILILHQRPQMRIHIRRVDAIALPVPICRLERNLVEQPLQHRVQAPRAYVLGALVDLERDLGKPRDAVRRELE